MLAVGIRNPEERRCHCKCKAFFAAAAPLE
jgi:hypothetical protein